MRINREDKTKSLSTGPNASPPTVSRSLVEYTAQLANLQYTADELEALVPAFQEMLRFVDTLQSLEGAEPPGSETEAWTPTGERTLEELRPDTVDAFEETAAIRAQFPRIDRGLLLVPRVIGSDED